MDRDGNLHVYVDRNAVAFVDEYAFPHVRENGYAVVYANGLTDEHPLVYPLGHTEHL